MSIFFTSDHHFGHNNVIKHAKRPFADADEMDEEMIRRWNSVVRKGDTVYHVGDVGMCNPIKLRASLDRLNGDIHLVTGNHDPNNALKPACFDRFTSVQSYLEVFVGDKEAHKGRRLICLFHYACRTWNSKHYGTWHLFGHSHGKMPPHGLSFDLSVDCHDFYPLSYAQVKAKMAELDPGIHEFTPRGGS
jgi:calcineurin-like phosphoesterase family protein